MFTPSLSAFLGCLPTQRWGGASGLLGGNTFTDTSIYDGMFQLSSITTKASSQSRRSLHRPLKVLKSMSVHKSLEKGDRPPQVLGPLPRLLCRGRSRPARCRDTSLLSTTIFNA